MAQIDGENHALGGMGRFTSLDSVVQLLLLGAGTNVGTEQPAISALVVNKVSLRDRILNFFVPKEYLWVPISFKTSCSGIFRNL